MAEENTTYTDAAGYEIDLVGLAESLKKLDTATDYFAQQLKSLSTMSSYSMDALVSGGAPNADSGRHRHDFAKKWATAAKRLLDDRTALTNSVTSFTEAMHDVHDTYAKAEDDNAANFRSIANH